MEVSVQTKSMIMDKAQMERTIHRMAHEIIEQNKGVEKIRLVGIRSRGVPLAERMSVYLKKIESVDIPVGIIDITLYRDDLSTISHQPVIKGSSIDFEMEDGIRNIPVEERSPDEVIYLEGLTGGKISTVRIIPENSKARNFGFDVTPARLVTGLITEKGIFPASKEGILSLPLANANGNNK